MADSTLDRAGRVRPGEEIDPQIVADFLRKQDLELKGTPTIRQFKGGASNLTYELAFEEQSFILRRPPFGKKAKGAHNMQREYQIMQQLRPHYPKVPRMIAHCADESLIGSEFYVMEKLSGMIPRANLPSGLQLKEKEVRQMCLAAIDKLIELHEVDYQAVGFASFYKGPGYVERQVGGWSRRYQQARTPDVPDYQYVMDWLKAEMPADLAPCIIHNDFRFDNLVYAPEDSSKIIGVLDWEMATVGDPLMDVGGSLAYWIEANDPYCWRLLRRQPTHLPGMLSRDEFLDYYLDKRNLTLENRKFYYIFGLFRLAVIIQQIYFRYYHKQTRNPQFKVFGIAANMLETFCSKLIKSKEDRLSQYPLGGWDNLWYSARFALKQLRKQ
ncbi:MAG TPA: phosphotransferase family protein [Saprospiraceae bacterium]|nr:phosphotransferase family protein [Saprospiraceae bacterium]